MPYRCSIDSVEPHLHPRQGADQDECDREEKDRLGAAKLSDVAGASLTGGPEREPDCSPSDHEGDEWLPDRLHAQPSSGETPREEHSPGGTEEEEPRIGPSFISAPASSVPVGCGSANRGRHASALGRACRNDAAKESNLPSRGLPGPASFEDWMGHQARAAPRVILGRGLRAPACCRMPRLQPVLERALDAGVERVQPVQRERLRRGEAAARARPSARGGRARSAAARAGAARRALRRARQIRRSPITRWPSSRPSSVRPISAP